MTTILKYFFYHFFVTLLSKYDCPEFHGKSIFLSVFTQGGVVGGDGGEHYVPLSGDGQTKIPRGSNGKLHFLCCVFARFWMCFCPWSLTILNILTKHKNSKYYVIAYFQTFTISSFFVKYHPFEIVSIWIIVKQLA